MKNDYIVIEEILNRKFGRKVCYACGNIQEHRLIFCRICGRKFGWTHPEWTVLEAIKIIENSNGTSGITMDFFYNIQYDRYLKAVTTQDFYRGYVTARIT